MIIYKKNFYYIWKYKKQNHNKNIRSQSYIISNKLQLNSKYIKTKQKQKLEVKTLKLSKYHILLKSKFIS